MFLTFFNDLGYTINTKLFQLNFSKKNSYILCSKFTQEQRDIWHVRLECYQKPNDLLLIIRLLWASKVGPRQSLLNIYNLSRKTCKEDRKKIREYLVSSTSHVKYNTRTRWVSMLCSKMHNWCRQTSPPNKVWLNSNLFSFFLFSYLTFLYKNLKNTLR